MEKRKITAERIVAFLEEEHAHALDKTNRLHDVLTNLRYEGKPSFGKNVQAVDKLISFFDQKLVDHVHLEEKIIFPFLEIHVPKLESVIHLLRSEHQDFRRNLESFKVHFAKLSAQKNDNGRGSVIEKLQEVGTYLIYLLRNHIQAERESIYRMINRELRSDEKKELAKQMKRRNLGRSFDPSAPFVRTRPHEK
jgi:hemerythrin-like domain-containing protein